jgi:hypothetical protein
MQAILRLLRFVNRLFTETETAFYHIFPSLKNGQLLMLPAPADPNDFVNNNLNINSAGVAGATSNSKLLVMKKTLLYVGTFIGVLLLTMAFSSTSFGQATVTSDADDYMPRSTATFTGAGFEPFEAVELKVKNLSYPCNTVFADSSYLPWTVTADETGGFITTWTVCDCSGDSLRLKATGQTSGSIAYAYFTDATASSGEGDMSVVLTPVCSGSSGNSFVFTFQGPNKDYNAGSQLTLLVPATWTTPQITTASNPGFISITAGSGVTVGSPTISGSGPWTVTVNFNYASATSSKSFTISYGGGGTKVTAPSALGTSTFETRTKQNGGSLTLLGTNNQPKVVVQNPPTATAGNDQNSAATCGTTVTLAGNNPPSGSNGKWTIVSGGSGSFNDDTKNNTTFTGTSGNTYVLRWTVTTGQCSNSDEVNITLNRNPTTADAGTPQTICFNSTATLDANTPDVGAGAGLWSIVGGSPDMSPTQFSSTSDPNAIFTPAAAGNYTLKWTISNSPCTASSDNVAITVRALPTATISIQSPNPTTICTGGTTVFRLTGPANGSVTYDIDGVIQPAVTLNGGGNANVTTAALTANTTYNLVKVSYPTSASAPTCETTATGFVTVTVVAQPVNPTINVKSPDVASVCAGQDLSATFNAGSGGLGCSDDFEYSTNGGTSWTAYTPGATISTASLAGQTVMIHGRHNNCTANTGCTATYDLLASWTVIAQPVNPTLNVKSPDLSSVCAGQNVSATFNAGSGGLGCSDDFEYSTDGGTSWTAYTPGANINTASLAGQTVMIHGRHNNCTVNTGCTATYDLLTSWTVVAQPVNPTLNVKAPNLASVCVGQNVSATFNAGSGGLGCSDDFEYSTNGGTSWTAYTPGAAISTASLAGQTVMIHGRHNNCTANTGCTATYDLLASWTVVAQPVNPTLNVKSPNVAAVCPGQDVSATFNAGSGGLGCSDDFEYSTNGGTSWTAYTPGATISTASLAGQTVMIHGRHNNCSANTGCTATYDLLTSWTVQAPTVVTGHFINSAPNTTNTSFVYGCTTPVLSVTATGQGTVTYKWFRTTTSTNSGGTQVGTGSSYTVPAATPVGTYYYHAEAIATCGTTPSNVFTVVINQQEAEADGTLYYTGPANAWTPNTSSNTATVTLSAFIKNSTAADAVCGDIATARITFQVKNSSGIWTNVSSAQNLPVSYVDPNNPSKGGTAAAIVQLNISNNTATQIFDLRVIVSGNYKAAEKYGFSQITISKLVPGGSISGGTLLCGSTSSGQLRPSTVIPSLLGFGVEYVVKQGKVQSPKGKVNLYVSSYFDLNGTSTFPTLNWYKISTNAIASLTITGKTSTTNAKASFTSKASVARFNFITGETIPIEGNCTTVMDIEDVSITGSINFQDKIALTIYRNSGGVWYSNNWVTSQTVARNICGGDLTASGTTSPISSPSVLDESTRLNLVTPGTFKVRAFPNPTTHLFTIDVQSSSNEPIEVKVFDMIGHMVYYRKGLLKEEHHRFGQMLTDGMYMLHVTQGDKQQTITIIKK